MVDDDNFLIDFNGSIVYFAYADSSHILIVVDGTDQHLRASVRVTHRCGNIVKNRFKQWNHIGARFTCVKAGGACLGGSKHKRTIKLRLVCVQFKKEF